MGDVLRILGLILGPLTIAAGLAVIWVYRPKMRWVASPSDLLIIGIVVGFVGKTTDYAYWQFVWTGTYCEWPYAEQCVAAGPIVNIFTRQIPMLVSAGCHLYAAWLTRGGAQ